MHWIWDLEKKEFFGHLAPLNNIVFCVIIRDFESLWAKTYTL